MSATEELLADEFSRNLRYLIVQFSSNSDIPYEGMKHFSCAEAEALADVIRLGAGPLGLAVEGRQAAAMLIAAHAVGDEYGDDHFVEEGTTVTTWTPYAQFPRQWLLAADRPGSDGMFHAYRMSGPHQPVFGQAVQLHIADVETYEED